MPPKPKPPQGGRPTIVPVLPRLMGRLPQRSSAFACLMFPRLREWRPLGNANGQSLASASATRELPGVLADHSLLA